MLRSKGEKAFGVFNVILLTVLGIMFIFPVLFVLKTSLDASQMSIDLSLLPKKWSLMFYQLCLKDSSIYRPFINSVVITAVGSAGAMIFNCMGGYALSKRELPGMTAIVYFLVVIPMFIGGGIVANYILYRTLGLIDTYTVLILPGMIGAMNIIIIRNYFWTIPKSLIEAAKIDGAGEFTVFRRIMLPLSKSVISATTLFTGVGYWNLFMPAVLYINKPELRTFAVKIRELLFLPDMSLATDIAAMMTQLGLAGEGVDVNQDGIAAAMSILSIVPILVVYPFMQKYFAAGMLRGSIKG